MVSRILVACLLFLLPFIVLPFGSSYYETPKIISAEIAIFFLGLISLQSSSKIDLSRLKQMPYAIICVIIALSLLHLLLFRSDINFFGNVFRLQGTFQLWLLLIFALASSAITLSKKMIWLPSVSLLVLVLTTWLGSLNSAGRYVGPLGDPNPLALIAVFLWPFSLFNNYLPKEGRRLLVIFSALGTYLIIFLAQSRSGLAALFIQLIFILSHTGFKRDFKFSFFVSCLFFLASLLLPYLDYRFLFENRIDVWKTAFEAGWQNPFFGHGFGNIETALKQTSQNLQNNLQYVYVDSSHNIFLDFWVQGGIVGLSLFLALIYQTIKTFFGQKNYLGLILLLGLITGLSFNPASITNLIAFWWAIGQGLKPVKDQTS